MRKNKRFLIGAGIIIIVAVILTVFITRWTMAPGTVGAGSSGTLPKSTTMAPVPTNAVVVDLGATETPADVAIPDIQSSANDAGSQYRSYAIKIEDGQFVPDTIILNYGDVMDLEITAVDGNYDFTQPDYGFHATIMKGQTQRIQGSANIRGKFTFYCASCGGPAKGPVGYFIVK